MRKYLYCIIRCAQGRLFDGVPAIGGAGGPVEAIPHLDLAAVASDTLVTQYDSSRANMLCHERVVERVMKEFSLLPIRFGTVADSGSAVEQVRRLLEKRSQEFHSMLNDMDGKVELGLKVFWKDEGAVYGEIAAQDAGIRRLRDSLMGKPAQATRYDRMRLGEMVKQALERKRALEASNLLALLKPTACRVVENAVLMDRMVLNAAFLVERSRERDFDRQVQLLDIDLAHRLAFKYVGPVPPYNFVNIVVNWQEV